jgi:hypothetical protein
MKKWKKTKTSKHRKKMQNKIKVAKTPDEDRLALLMFLTGRIQRLAK